MNVPMKLFLFTLSVLILSSCVSIYFTEPQPKEGIFLSEVPKELHGSWHRGNYEMIIESKGSINYRTRHSDTITNKLDTLYENLILSDTVQLFKINNLYVLNYRVKNNPWEIVIIEKKRSGNIFIYGSTETEIFSKDKSLKFVNANFTIDDKDTTVQTLKPNFGNSGKLNSVTYSGQMSFETIKKLTTRKYLFRILKTDGTYK